MVLGSTIKEAHQHPTSQIHGQSSKTPPSAGSDSDVLDDGITKEVLGLRRAVVNWKIEHMSRGSKIKDPMMARKKIKENRSETTDPLMTRTLGSVRYLRDRMLKLRIW